MTFATLLVDLAFKIDSSSRYKRIKGFFRNLLENEQYPYKRYFDLFMIFLVVTSVAIIIEEVTTPIGYWLYVYDVYFVTFVFLMEYLLRMWVHDDVHKIVLEEFETSLLLERPFDLKKVLKEIALKKWEYVSSPMAIIDLLAILPSYREFGILRIFVLFRVFKLMRYSSNLYHFFQVLSSKKSELFTLFILLFFLIAISGISIYVFEGAHNEGIHNIFDTFYWSLITISTVGYGDITPHSIEGRVITMIIIIVGMGLISFSTSIMVSAFAERLDELRKNKVLHSLKKVENLYIICGYSDLAQMLVERLHREGKEFLIIDQDPHEIETLFEKGYRAVVGDATKKNIFTHIDFDKVAAVLVLTQSDMRNIYISLNIRSFSKDVFLISRAIDQQSYKKLKLAGVNYIISPYLTAGIFTLKIFEEPIALKVVEDILNAKKNAYTDQIEIMQGNPFIGKSIAEIPFKRFKVLFLGVIRENKKMLLKEFRFRFFFDPPKDFVLEEGDILIVMGYIVSINSFKQYMIESSFHG